MLAECIEGGILEHRDLALKIAWSFLGKPYRWGGDDPMAGFDCSGFIVELLRSTGHLDRGIDLTAQGLWDSFAAWEVRVPYNGCLVFWQNYRGTVNHVELCLDNRHSIGASGGGGMCISERDAIEQNAYIKIRPFRSRKPIRGFSDPFLSPLS